MPAAARGRLAGILAGQTVRSVSSAQMKVAPGDLRVDVAGIGRLRFPVPEDQARQLCRLGEPARFGRGVATLTDRDVRDTWEIPKSLVNIEWTCGLDAVLERVREALGLPSSCGLAADLHSMLVYEQGQFFVTHQDSEKGDMMVATLVVTLPSAHTGGDLVIEHGEGARAFKGLKSAIRLVAFYADRRHQVRPVTSGYRITLTYNLHVRGDTGGPVLGNEPITGELAQCLEEHFTTPVTRRYGGDLEPPHRLVYLLDHEYTERGLRWSRLKGSDAGRVALLRAAADKAGCEAVLALADIQETWDAYEAEEAWGYDGPEEYEDTDEEAGLGAGCDADRYELQDLIDSSVKLTRWIGPADRWTEDICLNVSDAEMCATTSSSDLKPYASEYEGYMGNYGNTMDRWYRRAALVLWPRDREFTNRAQACPVWAVSDLDTRARGGDLEGARAAARTLAPFWRDAVRSQTQAGFFDNALTAAIAMADAQTAGMLLRPFGIESLRPAHAAPLTELAAQHGQPWVEELLRTWFIDQQPAAYAAGQDRSEWLAALPELCQALHAAGNAGTAAAHSLLNLSWGWLGDRIRSWLAAPSPSRREKSLGELGRPLAAILVSAAATRADDLRDQVVGFGKQQDDEVLTCVLAALHASAVLPADTRPAADLDELAADCAKRLRAQLARPSRADDDWSVEPPGRCTCELCGTMDVFLRDPAIRTFEWPLAQDKRRHIHSRIDTAELPVRHQTRRQGRPYTLVLTKTQAVFELERQARSRNEADLAWLTTQWATGR